MEKLLIVDAGAELHRRLARLLESEQLALLHARNERDALKMVEVEKPTLVVMDVWVGEESGLGILQQMLQRDAKLLVVMVTDSITTQTAIEAMKQGAYDYLPKGMEDLKWPKHMESAFAAARAMRQVVSYEPLLSQEEHTEEIVGRSDTMQAVYKLIGQASPSDAMVLITGESGTGKELVARAIYHHSKRAGHPFLAINCAAIPDQLLESELFGHEKGAFTGAVARNIGRFEQCHNGTIFLDEIGDMPAATQAKILRVLQEGTFSRVGGRETIHTDVRLIAATNKDVEAEVKAKRFREDLYYRLNVVRIHLPPLRERREDIPILTEYFLRKMEREGRSRVSSLAAMTVERLKTFDWPGNVRELENVLARAAVVARTNVIFPEDLPSEVRGESTPSVEIAAPPSTDEVGIAVAKLMQAARGNPKWKLIAAVERELIVRALDETNGNQVQAAKLLGMTRATLRKRITKFGIKREMQIE